MNPHKSRWKRRIAQTFVVFGALCFAFIMGEFGLRMFAPQISSLQSGGYFDSDPELLWRLSPNTVKDGGDFEVRINSHGLRDDEFPLHKPSGEWRLLGLGDSFTFGAVDRNDNFLRVLERKLKPDLPGLRVINGGVPGYALPQEIVFFERYGAPLEPDLVLLGFFVGNDFIEPVAERDTVVRDGVLVREKTADLQEERESRFGGRLFNRLQNTVHRSHVFHLLRRTLHGTTPADGGDPNDTRRKRYLYNTMTRLQVYWTSKDNDYWWNKRLKAIHDSLVVLKQKVIDQGFPLAVVIMPDGAQVHPNLLQDSLALLPGRGESLELDLARPQARLTAMLDKLGIPCLDLLPAMRQAAQGGDVLYKLNDSHWNVAGNRVAARAIDAFLRTEGLVPLK